MRRTITKDNYRQYKPSEFVRAFIEDIDFAIATGIPVNMSTFTVINSKTSCLPCLGGMAVLNMGMKGFEFKDQIVLSIGERHAGFDKSLNWAVAGLGDAIRRCRRSEILRRLAQIYNLNMAIMESLKDKLPKYQRFDGKAGKEELLILRDYVTILADTLRNNGY